MDSSLYSPLRPKPELEDSKPSSFLFQLYLLLKRNFIAKKRNKLDVFLEVIMPILFSLLIVLFLYLGANNKSVISGDAYPFAASVYSFYPGWKPDSVFGYAPSTNKTGDQVDAVMNRLVKYHQLNPNNLRGFATEEEMTTFYLNAYPSFDFKFGIVFPNVNDGVLPDDVIVKIRFNGSDTFDLSAPFDDSHPWQDNGYSNVYDFLVLQQCMMTEIMNYRLEISGRKDATVAAKYSNYPFLSYIEDYNMDPSFYSLYLVIGFIGLVSKSTSIFVNEKETRVREGMKIMGLKSIVWFVSWWLTYFFVSLVTCFVITLILFCAQPTFLNITNPVIFYCLIFAYSQSLIAFSFLVSTFFHKARLAGQLSSMIAMGLYFPSYALHKNSSFTTMLFSCLSSPIAFKESLDSIILSENAGNGINFSNLSGISVVPFYATFLMLLLDIFLYFLFAIYIDTVFPGEYGTPRRWYFMFQSSFWFESSTISLDQKEKRMIEKSADIESVSNDLASRERIHVEGLCKVFDATPSCLRKSSSQDENIVALDSIDLSIYEGQIFALLGHNGAGKSTLISLLTGLIEPTAGSVNIYGLDLFQNTEKVRHLLGVCPQHDVLFESLTVREHLEFYGSLKGVPSENLENAVVTKLVEVGLEDKIDAIASTLSGGQKRKLSVCIALIGNSKVVFLDEPTSGMDPVSRRNIWSLLQKYKKEKVIVLTTHFMDEADLLGDRIAIVSKGRLKCAGTSLFLKTKFGSGYRVTIETCESSNITELVSRAYNMIPGCEISSSSSTELTLVLPFSQQHKFCEFFLFLESNYASSIGVNSFGVSLTSLEEVFLKIAHEEEVDKKSSNQPESEESLLFSKNLDIWNHNASNNIFADIPVTRIAGFWSQFVAMINKRLLVVIRDIYAIMYQLAFPLVYVILFLTLLSNSSTNSGLVTYPEVNFTLQPISGTYLTLCDTMPSSNGFTSNIPYVLVRFVNASSTTPIDQPLYNYLTSTSDVTFVAATIDTFDLVNNDYSFKMLVNSSYQQGFPSLYSAMFNLFYKNLNLSGSISVVSAPLPFYKPFLAFSSGISITILMGAVMLGFAISYVSIGFGAAVVKEKFSKAKHIQYVMGVTPHAYWCANLVADSLLYWIPITITFIAFVAAGDTLLAGSNFLPAVLLFIVSTFSLLCFTYVCSFMFESFTKMIFFSFFVNGMIGLVLFFVKMIVDGVYFWSTFLQYIFPLIPSYSIFNGIFNLGLYKNNLEILYSWEKLGCLYVLTLGYGFIYFFLILFLESSYFFKMFNYDPVVLDSQDLGWKEDEDVSLEREAVARHILSNFKPNVCLSSIRKVFPTNEGASNDPNVSLTKVAVKNLSLGIPENTCFGLLGPNGAGKSTLMSILTGEIIPSSGSAWVSGFNVSTQMDSIFTTLGYCPQFDGLIELLTGREHLKMFAQLKGIKDDFVDSIIDRISSSLNLGDHIDKQCQKYSGGNKRKLALAIALIGAPKTILLDEPSSGVDPYSRRGMWNLICAAKFNRSIILTTHLLEEADILCNEIGIMVNGQLECLGSSQHLKNKFGQGYNVELQTIDSPDTIEHVKQYIFHLVPGSNLRECFNGNVRFTVPRVTLLSTLFRELESNKLQLQLRDYSISQTTLEQVFISFAKHQVQAGQN